MPRLPQFTAQLGDAAVSGGRRASAEDFGGGVGEALTGLGRTGQVLGKQLVDNMEQDDNRAMLVEHAKIRQRYAKELEDAELSGADVDSIREKLENETANLRGQARTKAGLQTADIHAANTLNVFDTKSAQVKVARAGAQARTQGTEWLNANGAILTTNPSYLPIAEAEAKAFAQTFAGKLPPEKIKELEQTLIQQANRSAVTALTRLAPEDTKTRLQNGEWNLSPEQRAQEIGRAESQIKADRSEKESAIRFAQYEKQLASQEARDEYTKQIFAGTFKEGQAVADSRLTVQDREHLAVFNKNWWEAKLGQEKKSDPRVVRGLMLRIYAPEGDPTKVYSDDVLYEPLKAGSLNATDHDRLRRAIAEQRDPNNSTVGGLLHAATRDVSNAFSRDIVYANTPGGQLKAATIVNKWGVAVKDKMDEWRKAGKNPSELFSPAAGKDYVMDPRFIQTFVASSKGVATISTDAEYAALPGGTTYIGPDGATRVKPGKNTSDPKYVPD